MSAPAATDAAPVLTDVVGVVAAAAGADAYKLYGTYESVTAIWNEWHGLGQFAEGGSNRCPSGGIGHAESLGKAWRRDYDSKQQKVFSRLKWVVVAVQEAMAKFQTPVEDVLASFDLQFSALGSFDQKLQNCQVDGMDKKGERWRKKNKII